MSTTIEHDSTHAYGWNQGRSLWSTLASLLAPRLPPCKLLCISASCLYTHKPSFAYSLALVCLLGNSFLSDSAHDTIVNLIQHRLSVLKRTTVAHDCQPACSCWHYSHFLPFCALRAATAGLLPARLPVPNGCAGFCPAFLAPSGAGVSLGFAAEPFTSLLCPLVRIPCHATALDRPGAPIFG